MNNSRIVCMLYLALSIFFLLSTPGNGMRTSTFKRDIFSKDKIHISTKNVIGKERIGEGSTCSERDISIVQGPSAPLPNGIPTYTVTMLNACLSVRNISEIHLSCGWFSSAELIDPTLFRRLQYDDCLVNDGKPLAAGQGITFQYANTRKYPLSVSSVVCS